MELFLSKNSSKGYEMWGIEKTINNVANKNNFESFQIPVFACQLAQDVENHKKMIGKKILEVKLDGVRQSQYFIHLEKLIF